MKSASRRRLSGWLVVLPVLACGDGGRTTYCPGEPPAAEACEDGTFYLDCGGAGPPLFACGPHECAWFPGGCVAAGMRPSSCQAEDICCHDGFPFREGELENPSGALEGLWYYGIEPWDRFRDMVLSVAIDPELPSEPTALTCTGMDPEADPCVADNLYTSRRGRLLTVEFGRFNLGSALAGEIHVDISESPPVGRAYLLPTRDAFSVLECPQPGYETAATAGDLVLDRLPGPTEGPNNLTDIRGQVSLDFPDGKRIEGVFATP